jgi:mono/diheme cytochrome c family protein
MIRKFYKSILSAALTTLFFVSTVSAQDTTATAAAAPAGGGNIEAGKTLFENNCKSCHNPDGEKLTGPGLKDIEKRRDLAWLVKWINNPALVIQSGDKYANDLYNQYNKTQMTAFPALKEADVKDILAYIADYNIPKAPVGGGTTVVAAENNSGGFTNTIMVALLAIMGLVLVALLAILRLLSKLSGAETSGSGGLNLTGIIGRTKEIFNNKTVRSAVIWVFILLAVKATLDGLYGIGVHQGYAPKQPIKFSHKLHAGEMKINCAYCHTGVYKGKQAGIPSANICMNCHNAIKTGSPEIQKIYTAIENNKPVEWVRVHNLPDLAYFNHAQHTTVGGQDCKNCHGEIEKMEVVQQRHTLTMGWCIDCHRQTEVAGKDNKYYDKLMAAHNKTHNKPMKVEDIGGLECAKCHY